MKLLPIAAAAAVVAVALGVNAAVDRSHPAGDKATDKATGKPAAAEEQLWTGTATLLQTPDGTLTLCGGAVLTSLPPAGCGGARVTGLDPMTVPGAERFQNGTITTPSVQLVGTWDGQSLTPTRPPVLAQPAAPTPAPEIPGPSCPEPAGGWPFDKADMLAWGRVQEYAGAQPDAGTPRVDKSQRILTVPFTGDLDRHRADIAKLYDGPVCVELVEHSDRELRALSERVQSDLKQRGLQVMGGFGGGSAWPYVEWQVVALAPAEIEKIEATYDGMLHLSSFLVPTD